MPKKQLFKVGDEVLTLIEKDAYYSGYAGRPEYIIQPGTIGRVAALCPPVRCDDHPNGNCPCTRVVIDVDDPLLGTQRGMYKPHEVQLRTLQLGEETLWWVYNEDVYKDRFVVFLCGKQDKLIFCHGSLVKHKIGFHIIAFMKNTAFERGYAANILDAQRDLLQWLSLNSREQAVAPTHFVTHGDSEAWIRFAIFRRSDFAPWELEDEELFSHIIDCSFEVYNHGTGQSFSHEPRVVVKGSRVLVVQRGGLDI